MERNDGELREELSIWMAEYHRVHGDVEAMREKLGSVLGIVRREREGGFREGAEAMAGKVKEEVWKVGPVYKVDQYNHMIPLKAETVVPMETVKAAVKFALAELTRKEGK